MVQVVGAETDQTWYFTNNEASTPTYSGTPNVDYHRVMTKGVEGGEVTIVLASGERAWFYTDELAACDVTFSSGNWKVAYWAKARDLNDSSKQITTRLHGIDSKGNRLSGSKGYAQGYYSTSYPSYLEEVTELLDAPSFTIPEGGRFAIEVLWSGSATDNLEIHCNPPEKHASYVTYPLDSPAWSVPELSTLILLSIGLIALAGYVLLSKKRN